MTGDTFATFDGLPADTRAAIACPRWCVSADGHRQSDALIRQQSGLDVEHLGPEYGAAPELGTSRSLPITVRARRFFGVDFEDRSFQDDDQPTIVVQGIDSFEPLTVPEAKGLFVALLHALNEVSSLADADMPTASSVDNPGPRSGSGSPVRAG